MAKLHGYSVQEALNASLGQMGDFIVLDASDKIVGAGSDGASITAGAYGSPTLTNTIHVKIPSGATQILVYPEGDIYWRFSSYSASTTTGDDIDDDTDLKMVGGNLISLAVPRGALTSDKPHMMFSILSTSATTHVVRIVGINPLLLEVLGILLRELFIITLVLSLALGVVSVRRHLIDGYHTTKRRSLEKEK